MAEMERPDPSLMRISDADRELAAEALREAAATGRLSMGEFDERLEQVYSARTYADLVPITGDIPSVPAPPQAAGSTTPLVRPGSRIAAGPRAGKGVAIMGVLERSGDWLVPQEFNALVVMGGARLDLRRARFAAAEVVLDIRAIMGGCEIVVDEHTRVHMEGTGIMGGFSEAPGITKPQLGDDSPVVRIRGFALWGGVTVYRKGPKSERPR